MKEITAALEAAGVPFVVRGTERPDHPSDLDIHIENRECERVIDLLLRLDGAPIAGLTPSRPHHLTLMVPVARGSQLVDVSIGPLSLGPHVLQDAKTVSRDTEGSKLTGASLIVDLLPRRLLAGKIPESRHVSAAEEAWSAMSTADQTALEVEMVAQFGPAIAGAVAKALQGFGTSELVSVAPQARRRYVRALLRKRSGRLHLKRNVAARMSVRPKPFGWPTRGTLVVFIGTDGTGKTTTATRVVEELQRLGMPAGLRYFGRTRGNLPGVGALRGALERRDPASATDGPRPAPLRWHRLRRLGSWYYAVEYALRFWFTVFPRLWLGRTVVMDRFVYDLSVMPSGSASAPALARRLVPQPTVVIHLEAPAKEIHERKPERTVEEISARQAIFATIIADLEHSTRYTVSTSKDAPDVTGSLVAGITMAAHRRHLPETKAWATRLGSSPGNL